MDPCPRLWPVQVVGCGLVLEQDIGPLVPMCSKIPVVCDWLVTSSYPKVQSGIPGWKAVRLLPCPDGCSWPRYEVRKEYLHMWVEDLLCSP